MNHKYLKYLKNKSVSNLWSFNTPPKKGKYDIVITIPCYNEYAYIFKTLNSISKQHSTLLNKTLVVIVINNAKNDDKEIKKNNDSTYNKLMLSKYDFDISIVDCYLKSKALPEKTAGVGMARKIACDMSLNYMKPNSLFCFIDADTKISDDYLTQINQSYKKYNWNAATVMFKHQNDEPKTDKIIQEYESFLVSTSNLLEHSGSPYNYIPIGSSMICNMKSYVSIGGMNTRKAAEDFYFLQELQKVFGVFKIKQILIYPSSRFTTRVYLGTSSRLLKCINGELKIKSLYYTKRAFEILKEWLTLALNSQSKPYLEITMKCNLIDEKLIKFLEQYNFNNAWDAINESPTSKHFEQQFHRWFDAFKTFKLLKYYSND